MTDLEYVVYDIEVAFTEKGIKLTGCTLSLSEFLNMLSGNLITIIRNKNHLYIIAETEEG